jgi:hypothetical protein
MFLGVLLFASFFGPMLTPQYGFVWMIGCVGLAALDVFKNKVHQA